MNYAKRVIVNYTGRKLWFAENHSIHRQEGPAEINFAHSFFLKRSMHWYNDGKYIKSEYENGN